MCMLAGPGNGSPSLGPISHHPEAQRSYSASAKRNVGSAVRPPSASAVMKRSGTGDHMKSQIQALTVMPSHALTSRAMREQALAMLDSEHCRARLQLPSSTSTASSPASCVRSRHASPAPRSNILTASVVMKPTMPRVPLSTGESRVSTASSEGSSSSNNAGTLLCRAGAAAMLQPRSSSKASVANCTSKKKVRFAADTKAPPAATMLMALRRIKTDEEVPDLPLPNRCMLRPGTPPPRGRNNKSATLSGSEGICAEASYADADESPTTTDEIRWSRSQSPTTSDFGPTTSDCGSADDDK